MTGLISMADAEALIALVATAADPTVEKSIVERKRELLTGLQGLIGADAWLWSTGTRSAEQVGDSMAFKVLDDGWKPEERTAFLTVNTNPEYTALVFARLHEELNAGRIYTFSRDQLMDDATWAASSVGRDWAATGCDHFVVSGYPLENGGFSAIGLYRRPGKPAFSERERSLVHLLCCNVDWLHREGGEVAAARKVIELSPRERQVVLLLIGGDGRKQVAAKLRISEYTAGDYLKSIYRKFGVSSRSELLAQFISAN